MSGDMDRWISLWSSKGIEMQPAGLRLSGIEQIAAALQPIIDLFDTEMTILPESVHILSDCAYAYGSYKHAMTPKEGGEPIIDAGMFLTILEKQANGSWKIVITCCNTSQRPKLFS
jgi:ketosteroid isomerase-like protein